MPSSSFHARKTEIISNDSGPCLSVVWQWPQIMLDPIKVFVHLRFKGTIQASHRKVIAFVGETDKIWAAASKIAENDGRTTLKMVVKLSPGQYQYTLEEISGHPSLNLFSHSFDNTTGDTHTTFFVCLVGWLK